GCGFGLCHAAVSPERAGLGLAGAAFAYVRPRYAGLGVIGIGIGIVPPERVFPAMPPAEHVARYGPPRVGAFTDLLKICAFPAAGAIAGLVSRLAIGTGASKL